MPALLAVLVCGAVTPLFALIAARVGLVDRPDRGALKIHQDPRPLSGGAAIVFTVLVVVAGAGAGPGVWVVAAILVLLAVGMADDAWNLRPEVRLAAQCGSGVLLMLGGLRIEPLGSLGPAAVVVAVPLLANGVNLTDGQDGLASGLGLMAAFGLWLIGESFDVDGVVAVSLIGALLGFLVWNRPPAAVFLGDGGAYALGGLLAILTAASSATWSSFLGSAVCLSIFAVELVSTVIRRATRSASLVRGDREHLYDLLARHARGRTKATLIMCGVGALVSAAGVLVANAPLPAAATIAAAVLAVEIALAQALRKEPGAMLRRSR